MVDERIAKDLSSGAASVAVRFFFSSRRRHTRCSRDWSSDVCSSDLLDAGSPEIVEAPNTLARTNLGLALSDTVAVTIFRFLQPVTDVQLWLLNSDPATEVVVEAHQDYHITYKDKRVLNGPGGILRLHADQINSIRIQGRNVILSRLHYDNEPAPYFGQYTTICGVKRGTNAYPLEKPSGLTVSFIKGGPVNTPDLTFTEVPYQAGLRWDTNEDEIGRASCRE